MASYGSCTSFVTQSNADKEVCYANPGAEQNVPYDSANTKKYRSRSTPEMPKIQSPQRRKVRSRSVFEEPQNNETTPQDESTPHYETTSQNSETVNISTSANLEGLEKCHLISLIRRYDILLEEQQTQSICVDYLYLSYEVTPLMRTSLINWLYQVTDMFKLEQETFHNAVCVVDFYLSRKIKFPRKDLHLLGLTALYIGSNKYDAYTLTPRKLVSLLNNRSVEDMQKMEHKLMESCSKIKPIAALMLKQLCKIGNVNRMTFTVASYIIDIAVQTHRNIGLPPPYLASGALFLAFIVMDNEDGWIKELMMSTGFSKKSMLLNCTVEALQMSCEENSEDKELEAVRTKYLSNQYEEEQNLAGLSTYIEKIWDLEL